VPVDVNGRRVAVVAGVGEGIGRSVALALAADGVDVVLGARDRERLERIAGAVRALGVRALPVVTDITDPDGAAALVEAAARELGGVDAVVTVAAWSPRPEPADATAPEVYLRSFEVNALGALAVVSAAVPHLRAAGGGAVVAVSSLSVQMRPAGVAAYAAAKAALVTALLTLAREVGPDGIRVNVVVPGMTAGAPLDGHLARLAERRGVEVEEVRRRILARSPLRRFAEPDDVAQAVLFLATDRSRAVTGQQIHVNAGEWMGGG